MSISSPIGRCIRKNSFESGLTLVRSWLHERCGIDYPEHKIGLLQSRLERVAERNEISDIDQLADLVIADKASDIAAQVVQAASTNHTFFFREMQVLDQLRTKILPEFSGRAEIRIWSAAASTGDEAYSVAMLAAEVFGLTRARECVSILGTDISAPVIATAERGIYSSLNLEEVTPGILQRYFKPAPDGEFAVVDQIKSMCTFRRMNLKARPLPFRRSFDIVLCRNILYYFDRADQISTLEAIHDATHPDGWLLTSVTEAVRDLRTPWQQAAPGIYRRGK